jgi:hypothetical protein
MAGADKEIAIDHKKMITNHSRKASPPSKSAS